jgi:hypothetical protein
MERKELLPSYYSRHTDALRSKAKAYYEANREKVLERTKARSFQRYTCEVCNKEMALGNKTNHERSFKHRERLPK